MDRYAVVGNPVAHSKSPAIHAAFARETGQALTYGTIEAPLDEFEALVERFSREGGRGLNVTLPFKHRAFALAQARSARAEEALAVNTLRFDEGTIYGDNTDGVGLVRDLSENLSCPIAGKRVLLMGAGGASYGVCGPLLDEVPEKLVVANRTRSKAVELCGHFRRLRSAAPIEPAAYDELEGGTFDVVINATSAGLTGELPPLPPDLFGSAAIAYDMVYGRSTSFLDFARAAKVRSADGLGMLVEQAAESFLVWRGVRPRTAPVIALLRQ